MYSRRAVTYSRHDIVQPYVRTGRGRCAPARNGLCDCTYTFHLVSTRQLRAASGVTWVQVVNVRFCNIDISRYNNIALICSANT